MAKPNSLATRVRDRLAKKLDPFPDPGEAWCVGCSMNDGKTLLTAASGIEQHMRQHSPGELTRVKIREH